MKGYIKSNWISLLVVGAVLALGVYLGPQLPDKIPSHWDINGNPDQYSGKMFGIYFLPILTLGLNILIYGLLNISPKNYKMSNSRRSVGKINFAIAILMSTLQAGILVMALYPNQYSFEFFFGIGMGLFLLVAGNFMSKVEQNFFIGVRIPWTLTSEKNWNATHRFAAKSMVGGGVALLILTFFVSSMPAAVALTLVSTLLPVGYSYWFFKQNEQQA